MATHKITRDEAFDRLRTASQHSHRKLRDLAADVTATGTLDVANNHQPASRHNRKRGVERS